MTAYVLLAWPQRTMAQLAFRAKLVLTRLRQGTRRVLGLVEVTRQGAEARLLVRAVSDMGFTVLVHNVLATLIKLS
jgi:hypothetical protein